MSLFWTNPTALFWTNPAAFFWDISVSLAEIGSASGSYTNATNTYTVNGTGNGIEGTSDNITFVNRPLSENIEIIANVTSQTGTNAYAASGLMVRDSQTNASGQCAFVSVSPQNGINFSFRTADGASATTTLGPSSAAPVWLRLVVSQTSTAGYQSSDGTAWELVGVCTMTLPNNYFGGLAVGSNSTSSSQSVFTHVNFLIDVPQRNLNMLSWLRADAGVVYDSTSSNEVSLWTDQSAQGYNGSQSNVSNQPSIAFNTVNGFPALVFSGSNFLALPSGLADFTNGCSIFLVLSPTSFVSGTTALDFGNGALSDNLSLKELNTTGYFDFVATNNVNSSNLSTNSALTANAFQLLEVIYDGIDNAEFYLNGVSLSTSNSMQAARNITRAENFIGQSSGGGNYFQGSIAEIILYNTALVDADRKSIEVYFLQKYSL